MKITGKIDIVVNNNNFSSASSSSILSEGAKSLVLVLGDGEQGTQRTNNNLLEDSPGTIVGIEGSLGQKIIGRKGILFCIILCTLRGN